MGTLGPEAYRAMYENSSDGVLFTAPDGRVLAANPAACQIFRMTEAEICALGRQGLADHTDERWERMLSEPERSARGQRVARMIRGDGAVIEVEMSASIFDEADGEKRTCTIVRDATERIAMERELVEMSTRLHELTLTDELTGLRNRRGFTLVGSKMLEMADRQMATTHVVFLDVENMKQLNDAHGHSTGDAALRAVARAFGAVLRRADAAARIGGDEFVALALEMKQSDPSAIEQRLRGHLRGASAVAAVGRGVGVSMGWATRAPNESKTLENLLVEADAAMHRAKGHKARVRHA